MQVIPYKMPESAGENFGKFIHQFQYETKTLTQKLETILIKFYRQNVYLLFNKTCLNERLQPNVTYFKIHDPAAHHDTDAQRNLCSHVKSQINYNKEKINIQNTDAHKVRNKFKKFSLSSTITNCRTQTVMHN